MGFTPLTLATVKVSDGTAAPTEWTIPTTLRVSVGHSYQLVKPIPSCAQQSTLMVSSSSKKAASIDASGMQTVKKIGSTDATGTKRSTN